MKLRWWFIQFFSFLLYTISHFYALCSSISLLFSIKKGVIILLYFLFFKCPPATSCFLDDNFLDERECNASWKNWPSEIDDKSLDFWKYGNSEMSDYNFDGPHLLKKRCSIKLDPLYFLFQEMTMYSSIMMLLHLCRDAALAMDRFDILGALSKLHYKIVPLLIYCILPMKLE